MSRLVNQVARAFSLLPLVALVTLVSTFISAAEAAEVEVHGYLLGTVSSRMGGQPLNTGEKNNWLLAEERLQVELSTESDEGNTALTGKIDFINDHVSANADIDVRELYGEYIADAFELRIGRQMLTWGVADRLFINDVFPKDWAAFFSGKPLEYMKIGSDMAKISVFGDTWDAEIALIPIAQYDVTPQTDRFVVYSMPGVTGTQARDKTISGSEAAIRLHKAFGNVDMALYAFTGFWHQPDKGMSGSNAIYPRLNVFGFTAQDTLFGGVLSLEGGFYQSVNDTSGTNALIANSQYRYLIGYEREIATDVTLGLQFYGELMHQHAGYFASAQPAFNAGLGPEPQPAHRKIMTVNLRALWLNQTLTTSLFAMMVGDGGGRMLNPDIHYAVSDELSINAGGHVFQGGPDSWMLGMMKHDDNIYMNVKWSF
jgi:hypothetical protein